MTQEAVDAYEARQREARYAKTAKLVSDCCGSDCSIGSSGTTLFYFCNKCDNPCDRKREKEQKEKPVGVENEDELHSEILQECRRRGWLALHGSMAHKAKRTAGEPDFVILRENHHNAITSQFNKPSSVLLIECKTRTSKASPAQLALHAHARKLGHEVHIVRSFVEFLTLL